MMSGSVFRKKPAAASWYLSHQLFEILFDWNGLRIEISYEPFQYYLREARQRREVTILNAIMVS